MENKNLKLENFGIKEIKVVDIDKISPNDWNFNSMSDEKYSSLKENIQRTGYKQLVHVFEDTEKEGNYIIADGEHRWKAMKELGKTEILVMVLALDKTEAMLDTVSSNMIHGDPIAIKMAEVLIELEKSFSRDELSKLTGLSEKEILEHEEMLEMPTDFEDGLDLDEVDELPTAITIYMMPGEYGEFNLGIEKCIEQMEDSGPRAFYAIGDQIGKVDGALKNTQEIANTKNRAIALEIMSSVLLDLKRTNPDKLEQIIQEVEERRKK